MIVWGGFGGLNTGGRYDPDTNSWTPTSTTNAPEGRYDHTAVWTGFEMIVWGGFNISGLNTGGRYNPSTDSWTATSTANAPIGRGAPTAVWTGFEMIVWGGNGGCECYMRSDGAEPVTWFLSTQARDTARNRTLCQHDLVTFRRAPLFRRVTT